MTVAEKQSAITVRVFIGVAITSELKMHLNQSIAWKHAKIQSNRCISDLEEVHHDQKDFIGTFVQNKTLTLGVLHKEAHLIRQKLADYCPSYEADKVPVFIFPQLFVA